MQSSRQPSVWNLRQVFGGLLVLLLMSAVWHDAEAQSRYEELALQYGSTARAYAEAVALPGPGGPVLAVTFRIPNSRLVFVQNREGTSAARFLAQPDVSVEVYRDDERVAEQRWRQQHTAATFEETQRRDVDVEGLVRFRLPPGRYSYRLVLEEEHTDRRQAAPRRPVELPDFGEVALGRALFIHRADVQPRTAQVDLLNLGGDVAFGQPAQAFVPVSLPGGASLEGAVVRYTLRMIDDTAVRAEAQRARRRARSSRRSAVPPVEAVWSDADLAGGAVVATGEVPASDWRRLPQADSLALTAGALHWTGAPASSYAVLLDISGDLTDGTYVLETTLVADGQEVTRRTPFRTHWRDRPLSLYDPVAAIRTLRFIEDRKVIKALLRGSDAERAAQLRAYWQERDPTPGTAANELMTEYYRRVDHAATTFRTGTVPYPDGLETDQARIYVLHGPPRSTQRDYPPDGGVEETWTYTDGRRFVFHAPTSLDPFVLEEGSR